MTGPLGHSIDALAMVPPALVVLAVAFAAAFLPRAPGHAIGALGTLFVLAVALFAPDGQHAAITFLGIEGVVLFDVDGLSRLVAIAVGILATAAVVYAYGTEAPPVMTGFALSYVASTVGVVFAGDWLSLIVWWELMAVTSTLLVWHHGGKAVRAGYRYAIAHGIGGSLFLFAVVWHIAADGAMALEAGGIGITAATTVGIAGSQITAPALLAGLGIGVNCGFIGLHTWLPDTYPRPHVAASVFLSVFTTKTGAYVLFRAFPEGSMFLAYLGGAMAVYGVVFALLQHDMRALLSYHIMAQVGYMVAGIGLVSITGMGGVGAMAHLFNNVLFKALLFMAVGVVIYRTGVEDLYHLGGLWKQMPLTTAGFALGALSITALPGFNGFVSKGMLLDAADPSYFDAGEPAVYWLLMIGAVGTFLSFIKLGYYAFLHGTFEGEVQDATPLQGVAMLSVGGLCVLFGAYWPALAEIVPAAGEFELDPYSTGHLLDAAGLLAVSLVGFAVIKKPLSKVGHVHDVEFVVNPLTYHAGRAGILGVTESYAAIDRAGVGLVRRCYWIGGNPVLATRRAARVVPESVRPRIGPESPSTDGGAPSRLYLRAGMGTTIMLLVVVLTLLLFLLVVL